MSTRSYGWRPPLSDRRDYRLARSRSARTLADIISLRSRMPVVWDQGDIGSCTGHGTAAAIVYDRTKQGLPGIMPSRLMLYYDGRIPDHTTGSDAGASIRDVVKQAAAIGYASESLWPYVERKVCVKPTNAAYKAALPQAGLLYRAVDRTLGGMQVALAGGLPVVIGITLYESCESQAVEISGVVPVPAKGEAPVGGHCMTVVGYDRGRGVFEVRNSWGASWGDKGYCWLPFALLRDVDEAWVITHV